jgi:hypothetical protein
MCGVYSNKEVWYASRILLQYFVLQWAINRNHRLKIKHCSKSLDTTGIASSFTWCNGLVKQRSFTLSILSLSSHVLEMQIMQKP